MNETLQPGTLLASIYPLYAAWLMESIAEAPSRYNRTKVFFLDIPIPPLYNKTHYKDDQNR